MNDKFFFKDPKNMKKEIKKLISFEQKEERFKSQQKVSETAHIKNGLPSKYATVLSCSFFNPNWDPANRTEEATSVKGKPSQKERVLQAI